MNENILIWQVVFLKSFSIMCSSVGKICEHYSASDGGCNFQKYLKRLLQEARARGFVSDRLANNQGRIPTFGEVRQRINRQAVTIDFLKCTLSEPVGNGYSKNMETVMPTCDEYGAGKRSFPPHMRRKI